MSGTMVDAVAGVFGALALVLDGPWLLAFALLAWLGPRGWTWEVVAAVALAGEGAARLARPRVGERRALARLLAELLGLAAMGVAFGTLVGAGAWWVGPGRGVKQDGRPALFAIVRAAGIRAGRVVLGLAMIYPGHLPRLLH